MRIEINITKKEATKKGNILTVPFKQKYDRWMKEYKLWAGKFALRRKRRLIIRI